MVFPPKGVKIRALPWRKPWSQKPIIRVPFFRNMTPYPCFSVCDEVREDPYTTEANLPMWIKNYLEKERCRFRRFIVLGHSVVGYFSS